ncbi:MAG: hypothetical protein JHD16_00670 [Solirubrobacteraceae bacterium]|nr:hypothetical protein [Solirubrobacteraceae bacterium]
MAETQITFVGEATLIVKEDPKRVAGYLKPGEQATLTNEDGETVYVYGANVLHVAPAPGFGSASF